MSIDPVQAAPIAPTELTGERIIVREWRPADAAALFTAVDESRAHLRPWMTWIDHHLLPADSEDYCVRVADSWARRTDFALGIWARDSGRLLGGTGFHNIDWEVPAFEIGYWIRVSEEGNGYITEAARLLTSFAFEQFHAQRLVITCDADNVRSSAVPQRLGFQLEARLRNKTRRVDGTLRDTLVFAMTPDDYRGHFRTESRVL